MQTMQTIFSSCQKMISESMNNVLILMQSSLSLMYVCVCVASHSFNLYMEYVDC